MLSPSKTEADQLIERLVPELDAEPIADDHRFRFTGGDNIAHIAKSGSKENPSFTLEVERLVTAEEKRSAQLIEVSAPPLIEFVSEGFSHKIAKSLHINKEFQTGDAYFDDEVYIYSNNLPDQYLRKLLADSKASGAILRLLKHGYESILIDVETQRCKVTATRVAELDLIDAGVVRSHAALLGLIAAAAPRYVARRAARPMLYPPAAASAILFFSMAFFVVTYEYTRTPWQLVNASIYAPLKVAAVIWVVLSAVSVAALRGTSRAAIDIAYILFALALTVPTVQLTTLRAINALASRGTGTFVPVNISELKASKHKKSDKISYMVTTSLHSDTVSVQREISLEDYDTLKRCGDRCGVYVRPGALGWPWLDGYAPLDADH